MNETKVRVVEVSDEPRQVFPNRGARGRALLLPQWVELEVDGLPYGLRIRLERRRDQLVPVRAVQSAPPGGRLTQRTMRDVRLSDLASAVSAVLATAALDSVEGSFATVDDSTVKPVSAATAKVVLDGRGQATARRESRRKQAIWEYRKIRRAGEEYPDIYAEVGRRIEMSRATAARYLADEARRWKS